MCRFTYKEKRRREGGFGFRKEKEASTVVEKLGTEVAGLVPLTP